MVVKEKNKYLFIVGAIILAAIFLRLWHLDAADFVTDEALNSFRSVGMVDILTTEFQTTPVEWLDESAWWLRISFHDHPILTFLIQNIFFGVLGVSGLVARLPFALSGILSVYLLYILLKQISKKKLALLAAAIFSVSSFSVWISRIGLQESIVISFILLSLILFIKAIENSAFWKWFGLVLGLGLLSKYTLLYVVPVVFVYIFLFNREVSKSKKFWLAWVIAVLVFSPVIIYNLELYRNFGHFDLQFSYLLKQNTPDWQLLPGKSSEGLLGNFTNIWTTLRQAVSPWFYYGFIVSLLYGLYKAYRDKSRYLLLTLLNLIFLIILLTFIGPGVRFLTMLVPFAAILIGCLLYDIWENKNRVIAILGGVTISLFLIVETMFSFNSNLLTEPKGSQGVTYTQVITQKTFWGYNELEKYLHERLDSKVTTLLLASRRPLVGQLMKEKLDERLRDSRLAEEDVLVIYDTNINWYPRVWYLNRRALYQGLPLVTADDFLKVEIEEGSGYYRSAGFETFIFIKAENTFLSDTLLTQSGSNLATALDQNGVLAQDIYSPDGNLAFKIYEF